MERNTEDATDIQRTDLRVEDLLSLRRMLEKKLKAPVSVQDFLGFLEIRKIEENLQFLLWLGEYEKMFMQLESQERNSEECRPWTMKDHHQVLQSISASRKTRHTQAATQLFSLSPKSSKVKSFRVDSQSPSKKSPSREVACPWEALVPHRGIANYASNSNLIGRSSEEDPELAVHIDNIRMELNKGMLLFIKQSPQANFQLNLSHETRMAIDLATSQTIHPSAFKVASECAERELNNVYSKFIKSSLNNANETRLLFGCYMGIGFIVLGLVYAIVAILSSIHFTLRLFSLLPIVLGIIVLYTAYNGVCLWLLAKDVYQLRQWEAVSRSSQDIELGFGGLPPQQIVEGWAALYNQRSFFQKVFDPEAAVLEPSIRRKYKRVLYKGLCFGVAVGAVMSVICVTVPPVRLF